MMERFSSLVTKSRPWPVIGRTIFFTSDKNRPTRDEIYFIDFWRENLSMYRINAVPNGQQKHQNVPAGYVKVKAAVIDYALWRFSNGVYKPMDFDIDNGNDDETFSSH